MSDCDEYDSLTLAEQEQVMVKIYKNIIYGLYAFAGF